MPKAAKDPAMTTDDRLERLLKSGHHVRVTAYVGGGTLIELFEGSYWNSPDTIFAGEGNLDEMLNRAWYIVRESDPGDAHPDDDEPGSK